MLDLVRLFDRQESPADRKKHEAGSVEDAAWSKQWLGFSVKGPFLIGGHQGSTMDGEGEASGFPHPQASSELDEESKLGHIGERRLPEVTFTESSLDLLPLADNFGQNFHGCAGNQVLQGAKQAQATYKREVEEDICIHQDEARSH